MFNNSLHHCLHRPARLAALSALALGLTVSLSAQTTRSGANADNPGDTPMRSTNTARSDVSHKDSRFVMKAAAGGMAEVTTGQLAQQRAVNSDVRAYAQRLATDHQKANNELMSLAQSKGISLNESKADKKGEHEDKKLSGKSGADFDKKYIEMMIDDHEKTIKLFEDEAKDGKDPDLQAFANKTLPTLREHLAQAKQLKATLGK